MAKSFIALKDGKPNRLVLQLKVNEKSVPFSDVEKLWN